MSETVQHSASDKEFLTQLVGFAERKAINGVLLEKMYSASFACPAVVVVALGEQALVLEQIIMRARVPDEQALIEHVSEHHKEF